MNLKCTYNFDPEKNTEACVKWIKDWFKENGPGCSAVLGMSGGKDSTIAAALCVKALGRDNVIGVAMPDTGQEVNDADKICEYLGIRYMRMPIGGITSGFRSIWSSLGDEDFKWSDQAKQNIPPRIRMTMLYAVAQTYNGRPVCTCNFSESYIGYETFGGDDLGAFSPLGNMTATEVVAIGDYLGLPKEWVHKVPDDGLPGSCPDEEKFGFSYAELDKYLRMNEATDELKNKIERMHKSSEFKRSSIQLSTFIPSLDISYR